MYTITYRVLEQLLARPPSDVRRTWFQRNWTTRKLYCQFRRTLFI